MLRWTRSQRTAERFRTASWTPSKECCSDPEEQITPLEEDEDDVPLMRDPPLENWRAEGPEVEAQASRPGTELQLDFPDR